MSKQPIAMLKNLERMKTVLTEWLIVEGLYGDACFYSIEDWTAREEKYGTDSLLILTIDGSALYTLLNYGGDTDEFDDLVESFGFYYELGYSWSMGFYPIEGYDYSRITATYPEKLQDPRWIKKSLAVKKRTENKCQDCKAKKESLEVHHCYYTNMQLGCEPWEYPLTAFRALCRTCHEQRKHSEVRLRAFAASLTGNELDALRDAIGHAIYWFRPDSVFSFLSALGPEERHIQAALKFLREGRNSVDS